MQHVVYLALGSNLGDRKSNLRRALQALGPDVRITAVSAVYETRPWGYADQPDFLNQVIRAKTGLGPHELLAFLNQIESNLGREATFRYGPRLIDLDILFYDDLVLQTTDLTIPHPQLQKRDFVLVPLAEIAPDLRHPLLQESIAGLAGQIESSVRPVFPGEIPAAGRAASEAA